MSFNVLVLACVSMPLVPRPPMAVIVIPMPSIIVVPVMKTFVIGVCSVSGILVVIRTLIIVMMTLRLGILLIVVTMARGLVILLFLVLPLILLAVSLVPLVGKCLRCCKHKKAEQQNSSDRQYKYRNFAMFFFHVSTSSLDVCWIRRSRPVKSLQQFADHSKSHTCFHVKLQEPHRQHGNQ
jgi:hypothetical protein